MNTLEQKIDYLTLLVGQLVAERDIDSMSLGRASRRLGIGRTKMQSLINAGYIPAYKIGTTVRVRVSDIVNYQKQMEAQNV